MAHRYTQPILVTCAPAGDTPLTFTWRGLTYTVHEVVGVWRLRDRWWESSARAVIPGAISGASDRTYYRVRCTDDDGAGEQYFDLYHDAISGAWVLDRIHD